MCVRRREQQGERVLVESTKLAKQLVGSEGKDERARVGCCSDQGYGYGYG